MSDIIEFLTARLDEDEEAAKAATPGPWETDDPLLSDFVGSRAVIKHIADCSVRSGYREGSIQDAAHIARHDPARVLREVAARRAILTQVMSWPHQYVDGDSWLSCAQAVDQDDANERPGSGCADEKRAGGPCECGLDQRRAAILHPLAAVYADHPDYDESWRP